MAKVTLRDVAEAAGVSIATASWAVNDNRDVRITESTRRKVRRAADELGYHHNALARGLARGCSDIIGFISDGVATSPFAGQVIQGAQDEAWRNGKILLVVDTDGRKDVERRTFSFMFEHQVEGIIGLEADDGRPETSPPPRRGVQTADRAVVRERQALPGDQGRARHRAIDPAAPGPGHPRQRLRPGRGQPHARAERAGRAGEAQQAVGDGGGRFRTSGAGIRTKAGVIRANAARYPISARCGILGVPRSTCYWMTGHPGTERADPIAGDVRAVRRDGRERYGARKIKAALERRGVTASRRRIVNIMKRRGMTSAYARRTFKPHKTRVNEARLANILDREFDGYEPRTHLASDLTYVRVGGKWAYVCLLIDLANRSIAGHSADTSRTADLVMAAFATLDFPLTEVEVFHTDRGSEFDNAKIDELLDVFDIRRSLSRKGNPYDNAVVESTNRLLKKELIYRNHYTSLEQLRSDLNDYVWWFNNQRLHSTLGYRSPKEFTEQGLVL